MPDLGPAFSGLMELFGPLVGQALKAFLRTTFGMVAFSLLLSGAAVWIAYDGVVWRALLAGLLAVVFGFGVAMMLGVKNAVSRALLMGLHKLNLGERVLSVVFDRLLGVDTQLAVGARGGAVTMTVENLPLAQAEQRLQRVVAQLLGESKNGRGMKQALKRRIETELFTRVERLTLAQFRTTDQTAGGVNLALVRQELGSKIDTLMRSQIESALTRVTAMAVLGLSAVVLLSAYLIRTVK